MPTLSRRRLLAVAALAAAGLYLPARADPPSPRLVVVLLRGALDGLAALPPLGDPGWPALRRAGGRDESGALLDDTFALHPGLEPLRPAWDRGELLPIHAVATPIRDRSHFLVQDALETGQGADDRRTDGWLYRGLAAAGRLDEAMAVGRGAPLMLRGEKSVSSVNPGGDDHLDDRRIQAIAGLWADDPVLGPAITEALSARAMAAGASAKGQDKGAAAVRAALAGASALLAAEGGPRVLSVELGGWDTHADQARRLNVLLGALGDGLAALPAQVGAAWSQTAVLLVTEFGRTAAHNGTGGTDHGTGSAALLLGGAVRGGRVMADWPGLRPNALFEGRDLQPTLDVRRLFAGLLSEHLRLPPAAVAAALPGVAPLEGLARS
jgi:uncharacterized protein (DUF1501 family)